MHCVVLENFFLVGIKWHGDVLDNIILKVTSVFRMLYFPLLWVLNLCRDALHCARNCVFVGVNSRYVLVLSFRYSLGLCQNEGIECLSTVRRSVYMNLSCIPNFDPYRFLIQVPKDLPSLINQAYWNKHKPHSRALRESKPWPFPTPIKARLC
jgi:hypothetical protein